MTDGMGIVYILVNPAMPGLIKVGVTENEDVAVRMKQLYTTGVPVPFECIYACKVADYEKVEEAIHFAFGDMRINQNREFFRLDAERVKAILQLLAIKEATQEVEDTISQGLSSQDKEAAIAIKKRKRPQINFEEMGIPVGAELTFKDTDIKVKVVNARMVEFNGETTYLTRVTMSILFPNEPDKNAVQPTPFWFFNGKNLKDIYDETYVLDDE